MREKPAAEIFQYILDLKNAPVALHRTKLMVVGYEKVGKTSLLECLFPFTTTRPVIHNGQQVRLEIVKKDLIVQLLPSGKRRGVVDSQDRLVVVLLGVKQGLDHSKGEFGVFGTIDCILHLFFRRIEYGILDHGTAEQSTMQKSQKQTPNERRQHEEGGNLRCLSFLADFMMGASFLGSSRQLGM